MRLKKIVIVIVNILMMSSLFGCGHSLVGGGGSDVIYLSVMSRPVSADVYWRIVSSTKEVMSGNRL
ncbi:MAG: hypothetical protein OEZ36_10600, partial [Spirochaetota bacterium]|nr:hypothetical protein [Spirochaetota bacterium]